MGASVSISNLETLDQEAKKPADASDIENTESAKAEVVHLRKLLQTVVIDDDTSIISIASKQMGS